jgi:hypothetical protein
MHRQGACRRSVLSLPPAGGGYQAFHALLSGKLRHDANLDSLKNHLIQLLAYKHWPSLQAWLVHWFLVSEPLNGASHVLGLCSYSSTD